MAFFGGFAVSLLICGLVQISWCASIEDKYEPMVAFICERPAMHRAVNGWIADKKTDCLERMEDILAYCKAMYPDHNITNVVESSYLADIPDWPMGNADRAHPHRVRPFRCLVGGFQSDALLVPQHCEFDHRHDQSLCEGFDYWNDVAGAACVKGGFHLESLGMLLNCHLGKFSGVEYVCCPDPSETRYHPQQEDDNPDSWEDDSMLDEDEDDDSSENASSSQESSSSAASSSSSEAYSSEEEEDENVVDLYEAYLRGQPFPAQYNNEHKKFLAAKARMKKNQRHKITKLLQQWQGSRDRVNEVRHSDPKTAEAMSKEIAEKFQRLYASYEQEDEAEKQQLVALHQQHVQATLNERKRDAMDKYMKALEKGDVDKIAKYLHGYIKAEEKDRMHTVNHFEHVKFTNPREALRIHPHIINHLKISEQRIDQALQMLTRFPEVEVKVRPEIEEFMKRFNAIATNIKNVVLPVPEVVEEEEEESEDETNDMDISDDSDNSDINIDGNNDFDTSSDESRENEHDFESGYVAKQIDNSHRVKQGLAETAASSTQIGSTIGIALGSISVFVIIVVAIIMLRRNQTRAPVPHGYVEVDPSASPEERHVANMQMNGYENPTYKYFEVQSNPKA